MRKGFFTVLLRPPGPTSTVYNYELLRDEE